MWIRSKLYKKWSPDKDGFEYVDVLFGLDSHDKFEDEKSIRRDMLILVRTSEYLGLTDKEQRTRPGTYSKKEYARERRIHDKVEYWTDSKPLRVSKGTSKVHKVEIIMVNRALAREKKRQELVRINGELMITELFKKGPDDSSQWEAVLDERLCDGFNHEHCSVAQPEEVENSAKSATEVMKGIREKVEAHE